MSRKHNVTKHELVSWGGSARYCDVKILHNAEVNAIAEIAR